MIIVADIHAKNKEPYRTHIKSFFNWLVQQYQHETVLFLGDLFDTSSPHNDIEYEIVDFLKRFKRVIILVGNHDFSKRSGNTLLPLCLHDTIEVYHKDTVLSEGNGNYLLLPYQYDMNYYKDLQGTYDFVFTHITPPECQFHDEGIQLQIKATFVHGHTHIPNDFIDENGRRHIVLGVPLPTRHLEDVHDPRILRIENGEIEFIDVPRFFKYETVKYGDQPQSKDNILNIIDAPSQQAVMDTYHGYHIRSEGVKLLHTALSEEALDLETFKDNFNSSIKKSFIDYSGENDISKDVMDTVIRYFEKAGIA